MWSKFGGHLDFLSNGKKQLLSAFSQQPDHLQGWIWCQTNCLFAYWELNLNFSHGGHLGNKKMINKCFYQLFLNNQTRLVLVAKWTPHYILGSKCQFQTWWPYWIFEKNAKNYKQPDHLKGWFCGKLTTSLHIGS